MAKDIKQIDEMYTNACEEYLQAFCEHYEQQYEKDSWVARQAGTVCCVSGYYISMEDMRYMMLNNITWNTFLEWYDYCMDMFYLNFHTVNLQSWCKGCPRYTKEKIEKLKKEKSYDQECF